MPRDEFDRHFAQAQALTSKGFKFAGAAAVVMLAVWLGLIGFGIWAVVQLLQHFGVI